MARVKPKDMIRTRPQAEDAMSKINAIDRQLGEWDMNEANAVEVIRKQFAELRKKANCIGMESEKALLIKELEAWAETDCPNWGKKTIETPFGRLGFRVTTPAVVLVKKVARSFKQAIELLQKGIPEFVRQIPEIDKEAILAAVREGDLDTQTLHECGLDVKQADEFWIESAASADLAEASRRLRAA